MITYEEFKKMNGYDKLPWGDCKPKKVEKGKYAGQIIQRAMAIVDGIKFYSCAGLLTERITKLDTKELFVYSGKYEETGEPVLWLTDKTGLTNMIEK